MWLAKSRGIVTVNSREREREREKKVGFTLRCERKSIVENSAKELERKSCQKLEGQKREYCH